MALQSVHVIEVAKHTRIDGRRRRRPTANNDDDNNNANDWRAILTNSTKPDQTRAEQTSPLASSQLKPNRSQLADWTWTTSNKRKTNSFVVLSIRAQFEHHHQHQKSAWQLMQISGPRGREREAPKGLYTETHSHITLTHTTTLGGRKLHIVQCRGAHKSPTPTYVRSMCVCVCVCLLAKVPLAGEVPTETVSSLWTSGGHWPP